MKKYFISTEMKRRPGEEKTQWGVLSVCINTWWEELRQESQNLLSGAQWLYEKKQIETYQTPFEHQENIYFIVTNIFKDVVELLCFNTNGQSSTT